jgi:muramoyltetrapeptide carboxypeptidase LdcA involved in peptidoglycan recycling
MSTTFQKPPRLVKGDKIAIISPSSCAAALFPHRVKHGVEALEKLGFVVETYPSLSKNYHGSAGTPQERADDINRAFADKSVKAIMASIGGVSLNEVLPILDYELIKKNPKIFCGYSDNTLLHFALATQANLVTFYGPCLITQFGENPAPLPYTLESFLFTLAGEQQKVIVHSETWTDEVLNWFEKSDLTRPRNLYPNLDGHIWLRNGKCKATIVAGCLHSLLQLKGTKYEPDYSNKILAIDFSEGIENFAKGFPVQYVACQIADLALSDIFSQIGGLVLGRPFGYTEGEHKEFIEMINRQLAAYDFPILANVNIGHADPIITLPMNILCELDSEQNHFKLLESGVIS